MNHSAFKLVDEVRRQPNTCYMHKLYAAHAQANCDALHSLQSPVEPEYCIMSKETCVGDHKVGVG